MRLRSLGLCLVLASCDVPFWLNGPDSGARADASSVTGADAGEAPPPDADLFPGDAAVAPTDAQAAAPDAGTEPSDAAASGPDAATGGADAGPDWRTFGPEQWPLVQASLQAAASLGSTGAPTAVQLADDFTSEPGARWSGTVLAPNGRLYGIPADARHVLEIDPGASPATAKTVGPDLGVGSMKWVGGVLAPNGRIYGMPYNATSLLVVDTTAEPVTITTEPVGITGGWVGGVRGYDGKIYGIPSGPTRVLVIDPSTEPPTVSSFGDFSSVLAEGGGEYFGLAAISPLDGLIYAAPYAASRVLVIDPVGRTVASIGSGLPGGSKWWGVRLGLDGRLYAAPDSATGILVIDPTTAPATVSTVPSTATGSDGLVLAPTGALFTIPWRTSTTFAFEPGSGTTTPVAVNPPGPGGGDWAGGALAPNGRIYAAPCSATRVLEIDPKAAGTLELDVLLGGYLNHY